MRRWRPGWSAPTGHYRTGRQVGNRRRPVRAADGLLRRRGGPPPAAEPASSCTSCPKRGIRPTGAGATCAARPAYARPSRAATVFSSVRFASKRRPGRGARGAAIGLDPPPSTERRCDPVDDERGHRHVALGELLGEEARLADGVGPGRGDEHVRRRGVGQQLVDGAGPAPEPVLHALEGLEEADGVLHDLGAGHLGDGLQQCLGGDAHRPQRHPGRDQERPEEAVLQEAGEAAGRVEQVERVAGRRGVDDHDVEVARTGPARRASPSPCTPACPDSAPARFW